MKNHEIHELVMKIMKIMKILKNNENHEKYHMENVDHTLNLKIYVVSKKTFLNNFLIFCQKVFLYVGDSLISAIEINIL